MLIDNIISQADIKTQQEYRIFLCRMNQTVIREITSQSYNKVYSPQLGGVDSFSFSIDKFYNGKSVANYEDIIGRNLIKLQKGNTSIGYFEIQNPQIQNDGIHEVKNIKAYSDEIKLINKKLYLTEGVFKLKNDITPSKGILNLVTSISKSWSIGYIDPVLINKERYFDIADSNIYELLMNKVQETFECVFIFDSINKLINVYSLSNFGSPSKIIVSLNNILQSAEVEEISNEIVTRLHLYGDNELTIRDINYGNDWVQNLTYFKNTKFMSQSLINALNSYESLVSSYSSTYSSYLNSLSVFESQLVTYNSDLLILKGELTSLLEQKSYLESIGQSTSSINVQISNKITQINSKENQINSINSSITSINNNINSLLIILSESNNFTSEQLKELDKFIIEDTYQDSSFLVTDSFTYNDSIEVQNDLLNNGINILQRVSLPRYKIGIDVIDFLKIKEFSPWWNELKIGDIISLNVDDSFVVDVRVTAYEHDWDNNDLKIQLGDKYQLDDPNIELLDLIKSSLSASTSVNYERYKYKDYTSNNKNEILGFINSSLDLNKNTVVGGTNQEITIDSTGYTGKRWDSIINNYSPEQLKITNNAIVLSDDEFVTAKTAIGKLANGLYGISAEVIAGKMILGNELQIETSDGTFVVDENGVTITDMSLNLTSSDNLKNILIDPSVGIKIRSRQTTSQSFVDRFYFNNSTGKFVFNGTLSGTDGTFSGALSAATGTFSGTVQAGTIIGGHIFGTTVTSANINISEDVEIGSNLTLQGTSGSETIYFANNAYITELGGSGGLSLFSQYSMTITALSNLLTQGSYIRQTSISGIDLIGSSYIDLTAPSIQFNTRPYLTNINAFVASMNDIATLQSQITSLWSYVYSLGA